MSTTPPLPPEGGGEPPAPEPRLPWEERSRVGFVEALIQTVRLLVTDPNEAFSRMRPDGDLTSPMLFGILVSWVSMLLSQFWSFLLSSSFRGAFGGAEGLEELFRTPSVPELVGLFVLWPVIFVVIVFIGSAIVHLCLLLVGAMERSEQGFEGTVKVYLYSTVAWLAMIVPFVGGLVATLWSLVLQVLGYATVHRTSQGRALIAVLIPTIVCCLCSIGLGFIFGAVIFTMLEQIMQQGGFP